jgi:hypothetical protein
MGKSMVNRECEWVSDRLPLWVDNGDRDVSTEAHSERGDLTTMERQQIERHLVDCAKCSRHRLALERTFGVLEIAANGLPIGPDTPSLWPALRQRIAESEVPDRKRHPSTSPRSEYPWVSLDGDRPIRQCWTHDTLGEILASGNHWIAEPKRLSSIVFRASAAAAILLTLIGIGVARRDWTGAQAIITANRTALADLLPSTPAVEEPMPEVADRNKDDVPLNQLADAEPARPSEAASHGVEAPVPKPSIHTRFGFDLEHGVPMPPDTRDAKTVY